MFTSESEILEFSDNCFCFVHQGLMSKGTGIILGGMEDKFYPLFYELQNYWSLWIWVVYICVCITDIFLLF